MRPARPTDLRNPVGLRHRGCYGGEVEAAGAGGLYCKGCYRVYSAAFLHSLTPESVGMWFEAPDDPPEADPEVVVIVRGTAETYIRTVPRSEAHRFERYDPTKF